MKLTILGSGTCVPYARRGSSGYVVHLPHTKLILDCGNGTTWKLGKIGINYLEIDHIFITHFHPDHTADLIPFLFATKNPYGSTREKPLHLWGPPGFISFFSALREAYGEWIVPEKLEIKEIENNNLHFDDFNLSTEKTLHTENSVAYRVESEGKSIVYTGDTDYSESLINFSKNTDALIIECSMPDGLKSKGHLTPSEVVSIANNSKAKRIIITHLYPICDDTNLFDFIRNKVEAEVTIAEDLLEIEI